MLQVWYCPDCGSYPKTSMREPLANCPFCGSKNIVKLEDTFKDKKKEKDSNKRV